MRSQPLPYPPLAFHATRTCFLISCLVVASILSFFVYHLQHDNFKIPFTFLVVSYLFLARMTFLTPVPAFRGRAPFAPYLDFDIGCAPLP